MSIAFKRKLVEAQLKIVTPDYCIATWNAILILIWRAETTLDAVVAVRRELDALGRVFPSGIGLLTIVEQAAPVPPGEVRSALARVLADYGASIRHSAVVHEGSGFRAAAIRGVVTGLTMLARPPYPHKVFAAIEEGCAWLAHGLATRAGWDVDGEQLLLAVNDLRLRVEVA
jgi:hypothetical protein